jgi:hypothetical protein
MRDVVLAEHVLNPRVPSRVWAESIPGSSNAQVVSPRLVKASVAFDRLTKRSTTGAPNG